MLNVDEKHSRTKTITVRYPTPSRGGIFIVIAQLQNDAGRWMVPTITLSGPLQQIIESGRFARDVGVGLLVASYWFAEWMLDVKSDG